MSNDFSSIDRLMEFGLGIAVARQMVRTMNYAMSDMQVAGVDNHIETNSKQYFVVVDGTQAGPINEDELSKLIQNDRVSAKSLIWKYGMEAWKQAVDIPEVNKLLLLNKK